MYAIPTATPIAVAIANCRGSRRSSNIMPMAIRAKIPDGRTVVAAEARIAAIAERSLRRAKNDPRSRAMNSGSVNPCAAPSIYQ